MSGHKRNVLHWCCLLLCFFPKLLLSQEPSTSSFADYLFGKGEYYRAITEYHRYLFFSTKSFEDTNYCKTQIFKCYYFGEDYQEALTIAENAYRTIPFQRTFYRNQWNNFGAVCYLRIGFPKSALKCLEQQKDEPQAEFLRGVAYFQLFDWDSAMEKFTSLKDTKDVSIAKFSEKLVECVHKGQYLSQKSPLIAGVSSALIPGSGYIYLGKYQTGLSSLLVNSLLIGTTYELQKKGYRFTSGLSFLLAFGWYVGNIYGSINSSIEQNQETKAALVNESLENFDNVILEK
jgi:hypothetical protein